MWSTFNSGQRPKRKKAQLRAGNFVLNPLRFSQRSHKCSRGFAKAIIEGKVRSAVQSVLCLIVMIRFTTVLQTSLCGSFSVQNECLCGSWPLSLVFGLAYRLSNRFDNFITWIPHGSMQLLVDFPYVPCQHALTESRIRVNTAITALGGGGGIYPAAPR